MKAKRLALLMVILPALLAGVLLLPVLAQTEGGWTLPVNLSNSGGARTVSATIDPSGVIHVLWSEQSVGLQYTRFMNGQWSKPRTLELIAFRQTLPTIVSTASGYVQAFWINDKGELMHARVVAQFLGDFRSWSSTQRIDIDVTKFIVSVDSSNRIDVVYMKSSDEGGTAAGIYYKRSQDEGIHWWRSVQLYSSAYIRTTSAEEANLSIASVSVGAIRHIFVVWDNYFQKQVAFARSLDGGVTFEKAIEIDKPDLDSNSVNPFHIQVGATPDRVVIVWQNGDPGSSCKQNYIVSQDNGETWDNKKPMLENYSGCATENRFLPFKGKLILLTEINGQVYFIAFNGTEWSEPQNQQGISSFANPVSLSSVSLGCRQIFSSNDSDLYVIGCDEGQGGDIWFTQGTVGVTDTWFRPPSVWSDPQVVISDTVKYYDIQMVPDSANQVQAFWTSDKPRAGRLAIPLVDYSRFEKGSWSEPNPVLWTAEGIVDQPSVVIDPHGRLDVAWSGGVNGAIYFNSVDIQTAYSTSRWENTVTIPSPQEYGRSPQLVAGPENRLFLAYLVPLNENRGIYFTRSDDAGETWNDPIEIFNALDAGWEMIGNLDLALTGDGVLHLIWSHDTLPGGIGTLELFYSRSEDDGKTWAAPRLITDAPVLWSQLLAVGDRALHVAWQEDSPGEPSLIHEYSIDSGENWDRSPSLSASGDLRGAITLTGDSASGVNLLRVVFDSTTNGLIMQHYLWLGDAWEAQESLRIDQSLGDQVTGLAATVTVDGLFHVLYAIQSFVPLTGQTTYSIYSTQRQVNVNKAELVPSSTAMPTPTATTTPVATIPPSPTPTIQLESPATAKPISDFANSGGGLVIGVGVSVFIVVGAFITYVMNRRRLY